MAVTVEQFIQAAGRNDAATVAQYVTQGGDINAQGGQTRTGQNLGITALMEASSNPQATDVVRYLLEHGTNPNVASNGNGFTALHYAAYQNNTEAMQLLLDHGASISANRTGNTPLHEAASRGSTQAMRFLIDHGASINAANANGESALHVAASRGEVDAMVTLVESGASVSQRNNNGHTPVEQLVQVLPESRRAEAMERITAAARNPLTGASASPTSTATQIAQRWFGEASGPQAAALLRVATSLGMSSPEIVSRVAGEAMGAGAATVANAITESATQIGQTLAKAGLAIVSGSSPAEGAPGQTPSPPQRTRHGPTPGGS
jgi:hypothetical protein